MFIKIILFFTLIQGGLTLKVNPSNILKNKLSRRSLLGITTLGLPLSTSADFFYSNNQIFKELSPSLNNQLINPDDPYGHWSFFGLVPPPVEAVITYDELLEKIKNNTIFSVQIAVQHDCIIATTIENHRLSCLVPDEKMNDLILDTMLKNGNLPFYILPIDPVKSKIRDIAQIIFGTTLGFYIAAEFNLIDYDTTPYSSIKERDDFIKSGKKPKKMFKYLKENLFNNTIVKNKNITNNTTDTIKD